MQVRANLTLAAVLASTAWVSATTKTFRLHRCSRRRHCATAIRAIYRFARTADDIADEGDATPAERLRALAELRDALDAIDARRCGRLAGPRASRARARAAAQLLRDLLSAFEQDVVTPRYASFESLLDYCRRSANPIGRLLLVLYRRSDAAARGVVRCDLHGAAAHELLAGRRPRLGQGARLSAAAEDLQRFAVGEADLASGVSTTRWSALMRFESQRTRALMLSGAPLARALPGRIGFELRLVIHGGLRILERIDACAR